MTRLGFTIVELLVAMSIVALLATLGTISLLGIQHQASLTSAVDNLVTDLRQEQNLAMQGEASAGNTLAGIYFGTGDYILFRGSSYSSQAPANFPVTLPGTIQVTMVTFPDRQVVFASGSGEIVNFSPNGNTITLEDSNSKSQKTITLNKYGVITSVN